MAHGFLANVLLRYLPFCKEEELVFIPRFPPPYGSLKAANNRLPILSQQQIPCEVGGAERALRELLCKNSSKSAVTSPRSPSWLHVEEWGIEPGSPDQNPTLLTTTPNWLFQDPQLLSMNISKQAQELIITWPWTTPWLARNEHSDSLCPPHTGRVRLVSAVGCKESSA